MASFTSPNTFRTSPWVKARACLPTAAKARVEPTLGDPIKADRAINLDQLYASEQDVPATARELTAIYSPKGFEVL
jgi:hypothetical protein